MPDYPYAPYAPDDLVTGYDGRRYSPGQLPDPRKQPAEFGAVFSTPPTWSLEPNPDYQFNLHMQEKERRDKYLRDLNKAIRELEIRELEKMSNHMTGRRPQRVPPMHLGVPPRPQPNALFDMLLAPGPAAQVGRLLDTYGGVNVGSRSAALQRDPLTGGYLSPKVAALFEVLDGVRVSPGYGGVGGYGDASGMGQGGYGGGVAIGGGGGYADPYGALNHNMQYAGYGGSAYSEGGLMDANGPNPGMW